MCGCVGLSTSGYEFPKNFKNSKFESVLNKGRSNNIRLVSWNEDYSQFDNGGDKQKVIDSMFEIYPLGTSPAVIEEELTKSGFVCARTLDLECSIKIDLSIHDGFVFFRKCISKTSTLFKFKFIGINQLKTISVEREDIILTCKAS